MYKKGNSKYFYITVRGPDGKARQLSLGTDNPRLARKIEVRVRAEIAEGKFFKKKKGEYVTVSRLLDIYFERHVKPNKKATVRRDENYLCRRIRERLGTVFIQNLSPGDIETYIVARRADGVSDITIHHELNLLRHAYKLAMTRWDMIDESPFAKVQLPKGDRKRVRYLSPEEDAALMAALPAWFVPVVIVAKETGLRISNICNLTWREADLCNRCIEIAKTKNGKPVWIPLSDKAYAELRRWKKTRDGGTERVFVVDGKPLHKDWVGLAFRRVCKRAGIENFRFHDLRHDFCSRLVQAGQPLHVVSELAGHEDISTTQRYAHLSPEVKRKAISVLNSPSPATTG